MRSCDHRNIMILYQGFPNWGVPLVICKPLKSGTRAALCQEQGGGRSWFSADLEETGKGCLGSECCSKCQKLPLWLFLALHQGAAVAFLEEGGLEEVHGEGGEQRSGSAHTPTHSALTHKNHSVPISPRLSSAQNSLPWTPELLDSPVPRASITPSLPHCCSAAQGLPEHSGTLLSCTNPLPAPRKSKFGKPATTAKLEKHLAVPQGKWDIPTRVMWWGGDTAAISFGFVWKCSCVCMLDTLTCSDRHLQFCSFFPSE